MATVFINGDPPAFNYESLTVSNTPKALTASEYNTAISKDGGNATNAFTPATVTKHARMALVTVETDAVRFTVDGTTVSATVGHKLDAGDSLTIYGYQNIQKARFHRVTSDATIHVTYYGG